MTCSTSPSPGQPMGSTCNCRPVVNGKTSTCRLASKASTARPGEVVLTPADIGAATEDQGALADTALQPGDNISQLNNDSGFITAADVPVVTGFVALDDGGTQQQITGGGGISLAGPFSQAPSRMRSLAASPPKAKFHKPGTHPPATRPSLP